MTPTSCYNVTINCLDDADCDVYCDEVDQSYSCPIGYGNNTYEKLTYHELGPPGSDESYETQIFGNMEDIIDYNTYFNKYCANGYLNQCEGSGSCNNDVINITNIESRLQSEFINKNVKTLCYSGYQSNKNNIIRLDTSELNEYNILITGYSVLEGSDIKYVSCSIFSAMFVIIKCLLTVPTNSQPIIILV